MSTQERVKTDIGRGVYDITSYGKTGDDSFMKNTREPRLLESVRWSSPRRKHDDLTSFRCGCVGVAGLEGLVHGRGSWPKLFVIEEANGVNMWTKLPWSLNIPKSLSISETAG